mmetsp:Transcript_29040/g.87852  ORF Transcript_29040/g.87852 Transcript_29040/m.87852 type:complete len:228 (+) Transcript_29040:570-1253(+)
MHCFRVALVAPVGALVIYPRFRFGRCENQHFQHVQDAVEFAHERDHEKERAHQAARGVFHAELTRVDAIHDHILLIREHHRQRIPHKNPCRPRPEVVQSRGSVPGARRARAAWSIGAIAQVRAHVAHVHPASQLVEDQFFRIEQVQDVALQDDVERQAHVVPHAQAEQVPGPPAGPGDLRHRQSRPVHGTLLDLEASRVPAPEQQEQLRGAQGRGGVAPLPADPAPG